MIAAQRAVAANCCDLALHLELPPSGHAGEGALCASALEKR